MAISDALDDLIATGKNVMLRLKGDPSPQPLGPGKLTKNTHVTRDGRVQTVESEHVADLLSQAEVAGVPLYVSHTYTLLAPAMINVPGGKPRQVRMPITFAPEDVLCILGDIINEEGDSMVVRPGEAKETHPGNASKDGLHIGGGS